MEFVNEDVEAINWLEVGGFDLDFFIKTSVTTFEDIGIFFVGVYAYGIKCVADRAPVWRFDCITFAFFVKMVDTSDAS